MIPLLPKWNLHGNRPTFYDADSVTMLELASTLHGSMNAVIEAYNKLEENVNKTVSEFIQKTEKDQEIFETALRQEFQDFIDCVNLEIKHINRKVDDFSEVITETVNEAIYSGKLLIGEEYDPDTESLNIVVSGGV